MLFIPLLNMSVIVQGDVFTTLSRKTLAAVIKKNFGNGSYGLQVVRNIWVYHLRSLQVEKNRTKNGESSGQFWLKTAYFSRQTV